MQNQEHACLHLGELGATDLTPKEYLKVMEAAIVIVQNLVNSPSSK